MIASDNQSAVLISDQKYVSMKETKHLLSSKNNSDRLLDSIEEIEKGQFACHSCHPVLDTGSIPKKS